MTARKPIDPALLTPAVMRRFWAKTAPGPGGCLDWTAYRNRDGYGVAYVRARPKLAHVVAYVHAHGNPPPELDVSHKCGRPSCVNPEHLVAESRRANLARAEGLGVIETCRALEERGTCQRGHDMSLPGAWVYRSDGKRQCRACRRLMHRAWYERQRRLARVSRQSRDGCAKRGVEGGP